MAKWLNWRLQVWILVAAGGLGLGCAGQTEETKRQLDLLNERMLILQNDRDRLVERVDALEQRHGSKVSVAPQSSAPTRPALKVVRLEPEGVEFDESDDSDEPNAPSGAKANSAPMNPTAATESVSEHPGVAPAAEAAQRVVLYGEGQTSGVRESVNQESQ